MVFCHAKSVKTKMLQGLFFKKIVIIHNCRRYILDFLFQSDSGVEKNSDSDKLEEEEKI